MFTHDHPKMLINNMYLHCLKPRQIPDAIGSVIGGLYCSRIASNLNLTFSPHNSFTIKDIKTSYEKQEPDGDSKNWSVKLNSLLLNLLCIGLTRCIALPITVEFNLK